MNEQNTIRQRAVIVIGAGLTGLTTAHFLRLKQRDVEVLEQTPRIGGQIRTHTEEGFTFESGPNTGVISYPEVAELFTSLLPHCQLETACKASACRLIWKGKQFHALPSGVFSGLFTPLFTLSDKWRILGEPWRPIGTNPDESVGDLARRRLGNSFVDYAVDPFISGVYAGDPDRLITRYALPKLYQLEQHHGSFIRGALAKRKEPKSKRDRLATKKVFSARGGLSNLTDTLGSIIGHDRITLNAQHVTVQPQGRGWRVGYQQHGSTHLIECDTVITTVGAYALPSLLPFVAEEAMRKLSNLRYAPVMQVSVGLRQMHGMEYLAFGGLVPACERQKVLGILFPSSCFEQRAPEGGALFSYFIGGMRNAELMQMSDEEVAALVEESLHTMLYYPAAAKPDLVRIFRHTQAIPQYELSSGERLATIEGLQQQYPGLVIAGNLRGGIGMADRIRQATELGRRY
ncbi:MAG: protoporphyrinogen oxidase [Prevotellaceae bacterium]|jgi:oxygen-dependent protoporphyrinogen oxidase|nr:protoporphyrinogen oxidase [Prevotellaceae bacterium]